MALGSDKRMYGMSEAMFQMGQDLREITKPKERAIDGEFTTGDDVRLIMTQEYQILVDIAKAATECVQAASYGIQPNIGKLRSYVVSWWTYNRDRQEKLLAMGRGPEIERSFEKPIGQGGRG